MADAPVVSAVEVSFRRHVVAVANAVVDVDVVGTDGGRVVIVVVA